MKNIEKELKVVLNAIKNDPELRYGYQSNVAVPFMDAYARYPKKYKNRSDIHKIANEAANQFLNVWLNGITAKPSPITDLGES